MPGVANRFFNVPPAVRFSDLNERSSACTVWRPLWSVHSTSVPAGTVSSGGSKAKFLTVIRVVDGEAGGIGAADPPFRVWEVHAPRLTAATQIRKGLGR